MRSWTFIIHQSRWDCPILISFFHNFKNFFFIYHILLCQVFNVNSFIFILMNFKIIILGIKEIFYFFIINFTHWNFDWKFNVLAWTFNPVKDGPYHSRNNTLIFNICYVWSHHSKSFSRWCLAVCKYCSIESFQHWINNWSSCCVININLLWFHVKNWIKHKFIFSIFGWLIIWHVNHYIFFIGIKLKATLPPFIYFLLI